ncbi:UbiE/COQ5 methyltransferase (macronuclear) [Tetrahymena thermophila SB210]|uniref:UbiE/COQ5 methyltransferase n=1 Tax=Tetrahymena thermophila (strain SB210) TaxID=312017 RepID=Q22D66_TETTS|nr:UbiE/COQ5 methyltransferase [Tetrahymena thermophila SB210]EAR83259.1 UbiE/COQ5 methyltransferase [Tetrahymena thermophila SB210]|eukprot:XP_001030922.1 UbiE/COQ5 methyltransferase [Tetrahymena thermophila SB210]
MIAKTIPEIEAYWNQFSQNYVNMYNGSSTFYLSLINMLQIQNRNCILEVGAGSGFLFHHTMNYKKSEAKYVATDLSENMLQYILMRLNIKEAFKDKYFISSYNLTIEKANGEELPFLDGTFDCYIANLCLQITNDPAKMLKESYRVLQKGGVAGFSVQGDKEKSSLFTIISDILTEYGCLNTQIRSNFHLNNRQKLIQMMEEAGFTNIICWDQFSPYHIQIEDMLNYLDSPNNTLALQKAGQNGDEIKQKIQEKLKDLINNKKLPLGLDALLIIGVKN